MCVCSKKGPHGLDGAVEKYFQKGENAASRFPRGKVVDVFWREDVGGGGGGGEEEMGPSAPCLECLRGPPQH